MDTDNKMGIGLEMGGGRERETKGGITVTAYKNKNKIK